MKNKSQKQIVADILLAEGKISRNRCLQMYISRLSAIIFDLKKEGWEFTEKNIHENGGINYYYVMTKSPFQRVVRFVPGLNKEIVTFEKA